MKLLPGVRIFGMLPQTLWATTVADEIWRRHGAEAVITCGIEGKHSNNSLHYAGAAFDMRRRNLTNPSPLREAVAELDESLGDDFDVVLESDHVHIEFQPHNPY